MASSHTPQPCRAGCVRRRSGFHAQTAGFFALSVETRMSPMSMDGTALHHCFRMAHHNDRVCRRDFRGLQRRKWRVPKACRQTLVSRRPATSPHTGAASHPGACGSRRVPFSDLHRSMRARHKIGGLGLEPRPVVGSNRVRSGWVMSSRCVPCRTREWAATSRFWCTVMRLNGRGIWWAHPIPSRAIAGDRRRSRRCPLQTISPELGRCAPAIRLSRVLLPEPFGPIIPSSVPCCTAKLTFSRARTPPKRFDTLVSEGSGHHCSFQLSAL